MSKEPKSSESQLSAVLRRLRKEHGLSQSQFARISGISQALVSQVEAGARTLPLRAVRRIAERFSIDVNAILGMATIAQVLPELSKAWQAYDDARAEQSKLITRICQISIDFERLWPVVCRQLQQIPGVQHLELGRIESLGTQLFREQIRATLIPEKEKHTDYRTLPGGSLPSRKKLRSLLKLASNAGQLKDEDIELLSAIVRRLNGQFQSNDPTNDNANYPDESNAD